MGLFLLLWILFFPLIGCAVDAAMPNSRIAFPCFLSVTVMVMVTIVVLGYTNPSTY